MNLRHLIFFQELAKTQHMARAAENLGISQPSLSYAINGLEKELGVPLFEREGRNIRLSKFGILYLSYVNQGVSALAQGQALIQQSLNDNTGHVNFGFTYTLGQSLVPTVLESFQSNSANNHITFSFTQGNSHRLLEELRNEEHDFVLTSYVKQLGTLITNKEFIFTPLVNQEIMLAVPTGHPLASKKNVFVSDIAKYPLISYSKSSGLRPLIEQIFKHSQIHPHIQFEVEEDHTVIGFVQHGFGIALVPNLPQLNQSNVKLLHLTDNYITHPLYLATKINQFQTPSVIRFKDFLLKYCAKRFTNQGRLI